MSISITTGDVLNVKLGYQLTGNVDIAYNVLHYTVGSQTGTPPSIATALAAIALAMFNKFSLLWKVDAGADVAMHACTVQDVFPLPRSVAQTYVAGTPVVGVGGAEALPLQDSPTLLKTTDYGQRWGIGRLFYVGLAEALADSGQVTAGAQAALTAFAVGLSDVVTVTSGGWAANLTPVLISGPEDNITRITTVRGGRLSSSIIKSQKRRRPGKGI